jgi:medium-chain acyl-[acyl-carrier-protein] hydrolase
VTEWIRRHRRRERARLRLLSFPHAGGSAALFSRWADMLPDSVDFCAVELPGHGARLGKPCFTQLPPLIDGLVTALAPVLDIPFCLFGTSFGALIAFEMARRLQRLGGSEPLRLFIAARQAPHLPARSPIHGLGDEEFVAALRSFDGTPDEILNDATLLAAFLPSLRADFMADETYSWVEGPPLSCPISAFGGRQDRSTTEHDLTAWKNHTIGPFELRMLSGGHVFPFVGDSESALLRAIRADLDIHLLERGPSLPDPAGGGDALHTG